MTHKQLKEFIKSQVEKTINEEVINTQSLQATNNHPDRENVDDLMKQKPVQDIANKLANNPELLKKSIEILSKSGIDKETLIKAAKEKNQGKNIENIIGNKLDSLNEKFNLKNTLAGAGAGAFMASLVGASTILGTGMAAGTGLATANVPELTLSVAVIMAIGTLLGAKSGHKEDKISGINLSRQYKEKYGEKAIEVIRNELNDELTKFKNKSSDGVPGYAERIYNEIDSIKNSQDAQLFLKAIHADYNVKNSKYLDYVKGAADAMGILEKN